MIGMKVLPPWGLVPHWKRTIPDAYFPWKKFFQVEKIQEYIPAIELTEYMDGKPKIHVHIELN